MTWTGASVPSPASNIADLTWAEAGTLRCSIPPSRHALDGDRQAVAAFDLRPHPGERAGHPPHRPGRQRAIAGEGRADPRHAGRPRPSAAAPRCRYCRNRPARPASAMCRHARSIRRRPLGRPRHRTPRSLAPSPAHPRFRASRGSASRLWPSRRGSARGASSSCRRESPPRPSSGAPGVATSFTPAAPRHGRQGRSPGRG